MTHDGGRPPEIVPAPASQPVTRGAGGKSDSVAGRTHSSDEAASAMEAGRVQPDRQVCYIAGRQAVLFGHNNYWLQVAPFKSRASSMSCSTMCFAVSSRR